MRTTRSGQSAFLLLDAIAILNKMNTEYAVIGAMAASFYGVVRASFDADALISAALPALGNLEKAFTQAGFRTELRRGDFDDPISALLALTDGFGNRVDLLVGIRGMDQEVFSRSIETPFEGERLRMIGLEDFVAMKVFAGSPKDLEDARQAISVSGDALNRQLLETITSRFGRKSLQVLKSLL